MNCCEVLKPGRLNKLVKRALKLPKNLYPRITRFARTTPEILNGVLKAGYVIPWIWGEMEPNAPALYWHWRIGLTNRSTDNFKRLPFSYPSSIGRKF